MSNELIKRENGIWQWNSAFNDPNELMSDMLLKKWKPYNNDGGGSTLIGRSTILHENEKAYNQILDVYSKCLQEYINQNNLNITTDNLGVGRWLVRDYAAGSVMTAHIDGYSYVKDGENEVRPIFTIILYINDDYEGGEIHFPNENVAIKPDAGSVLIFPSNLLHEVKTVISGNRYMTQSYIYEKTFSCYQEKIKENV
jgi:predicted 2-oxoglutarate/Fe(II)-dependent dioxygenase YbiX